MRVLRQLLTLPFRVITIVWNVLVHGEAVPDRGQTHESRVAAREQRKRTERHGNPERSVAGGAPLLPRAGTHLHRR